MRRLLLIVLLLSTLSTLWAQDRREKFNPEAYRAEMEQYITKKACLTPQEASEFFPIYEEMLSKQRSLRDKIKSLRGIKPTTDSECKENITQRDNIEIELKQLQRTYHEKFLQVLPASKVYDIMRAEDTFLREAFKNVASEVGKK